MEPNSQPAREDPPRPVKGISQFGLKVLAPGINPDVDIVAIHEIDGDREDSWKAGNGALWLRDFLPTKIPNARIITYGYDADTHSRNQLATDSMHEHAMTFVSKLALFREETTTLKRPIVFVAYSFGGLLLKSALIHAHSCHENHLKYHLAVSQSTHGVTFFGTPHQGSAIANLARSILDKRFVPTSNVLLQHLERNSEVLQQQLVQYLAISRRFDTKFFYEMYDTNVSGRVVPRTSAVVPGAVDADAIGIHKDHFNLVKFLSADDEDFQVVSTVLSLMSKAAQQKSIIQEVVLTPSERNALSNLPHVDAARFDVGSRPHCLEGTRVDLRERISEWIEKDMSREHRQIFWLCGQPGTGKTTISFTVASDCEVNGRLGASFFFSRDNADQSNFDLVFPTIAQQLGIFHRPFQKSLAKVLERDLAVVRMEPTRQLKKLIIEPFKSCDSFPASTIVVIDALDECKDEDPISRMLSILSAHIDELPCLKFFITSRPEDHIVHGFRQLSISAESVILHEIDSSVVDADIEHYLRVKISAGSSLYPHLLEPGWPTNEAILSLVEKSGRLFIFAATAINFLFDRAYSHPHNQLTLLLSQAPTITSSPFSPFAFLDRLYLQVLRQAFSKETIPERVTLLRKILGAIVLLRNPLSPGALESLLILERGMVRTTLRHLHSVLVVPDTDQHPIRLIHPSFFDFFTSHGSGSDFRIDSLAHHEQIGISCFKQMEGLKRNICQIQDASKLNIEIEDLAQRIERHISPAMQYACLNWSSHLCIVGGDTLQGLLGEFCRRKILYWIEALSLLGYLRDGIRHLQDVAKFFNTFPTPPEKLLVALADSTWLMAQGFELISCASLQIYRTALPLSSPSSFLSMFFHHESDGGLRVLQGEWIQKSPGVTMLRGSKDSITSVAFSPDGTLIVSASADEVTLWDRDTGGLLQKLNADPNLYIKWARFFPDGNRVIAGTAWYTILIWNITTGACLQTIRLGGVDSNYRLRCSTISSDFTRTVGSMANNIHIWHTFKGDLLNTLSEHSGRVNSVTFSPNHMLIASASDDNTIRIWDAVNGDPLRRFQGPANWIGISPDSKYIVSSSLSNDIRLWDWNSGVVLKTLKGHTQSVRSVAFSPNGARVISGSLDHTLRVWDAISGELLKTLECLESDHHGVHNVGFSPDGTQYVSSLDCTIYLWDADQASNPKKHTEWHVDRIQFSTDGTYIFGRHAWLNSLYVWDGYTGNYWMYEDDAKPSPNAKYIASISINDYILCLWDIASRTPLWEIRRGSTMSSFEFSSDSTRIVSTSFDYILRIWDVDSGNNLFAIRIHPNLYYSALLSFSSDGSQIITQNGRIYIPPHVRPRVMPPVDATSEQLNYLMRNEWIFASSGGKEERCVWIPYDWRQRPYATSHGRVAIASRGGLVLLDLSGIPLSL